MTQQQPSHELTVIYDGECGFCKECVRWLEKKTVITALPFQSADLARYGVTYERCSKEVVAIINGKVFGGADAVAKLLHFCGYKTVAFLLRFSGPIGRTGYKWIASHRHSSLVRIAHWILKARNRK